MRDHPLILHIFPSFDPGGMELRMAGFLNWSRDRYKHMIVPLDGRTGARQALGNEVEIKLYPELDKGTFWRRQRAISLAIRSIKPDMLVTYNWGAIEWAFCRRVRFSNIPHVHIEGGFGIAEAHRVLPRRSLFRRIALARSAAVVVPSVTLREIASSAWRLKESRVHHILSGVDSARFIPVTDTPVPEAAVSRSTPIVIGTVASFRPEKCLRRLVEAFDIIRQGRDVRLLLVGDGKEMNRLTELVKTRGLQDFVNFVGFRDDPENYYLQMDVFALSSETEQLPNVVLQAMASGLPVASTDVGDVRRTVSEANRPFVTGCDSDSLARSIAELVADKELRQKIGALNRSRVVGEYGLDAMNQAYLDIMEAALS